MQKVISELGYQVYNLALDLEESVNSNSANSIKPHYHKKH